MLNLAPKYIKNKKKLCSLFALRLYLFVPQIISFVPQKVKKYQGVKK